MSVVWFRADRKWDLFKPSSILQNLVASCADSEGIDAGKKTAVGLSELSELYAKRPKLLSDAPVIWGFSLVSITYQDLQSLVAPRGGRLSQQAAARVLTLQWNNRLSDLLRSKHQTGVHVPARENGHRRAGAGIWHAKRCSRGKLLSDLQVLNAHAATAMEQAGDRVSIAAPCATMRTCCNLAGDLGEDACNISDVCCVPPRWLNVRSRGTSQQTPSSRRRRFYCLAAFKFPRTSQDRIVRQISASGAVGAQHPSRTLDRVGIRSSCLW